MKIIEAMKKIKDHLRKCEDLRVKISNNSASLSIETPVYGDRQSSQVAEWLQSHSDTVKDIGNLRYQITKTNVETLVDVTIGGVVLNKSISEWIQRRKDLATLEHSAWAALTDRGLREQLVSSTTGGEPTQVKIIRHFDPTLRDKKLEEFASEKSLIDAALEIANATTDLI